ncbi:hypothetical protein GCM10017687_87460 [Streptomyces echinatus]
MWWTPTAWAAFCEAITEGGEPPAYECAECSTGQASVVPTQTADDPDGEVLLCLTGGHPLDFALPDMCSWIFGGRSSDRCEHLTRQVAVQAEQRAGKTAGRRLPAMLE